MFMILLARLKWMWLIFFFSISLTVAHASVFSSRVVDEKVLLHPVTMKRLIHKLSEAAQKREVYIHVFITCEYAKSIEEITKEAVNLWIKEIPYLNSKSKVVYLVINAARKESLIVSQLAFNDTILEGFNNIHQWILTPALLSENIDKAALEGAVALSMVFEDWPKLGKINQWIIKIDRYLTKLHLMPLGYLLQCLIVFFIIYILGTSLKRYFYRSHWRESIAYSTKS